MLFIGQTTLPEMITMRYATFDFRRYFGNNRWSPMSIKHTLRLMARDGRIERKQVQRDGRETILYFRSRSSIQHSPRKRLVGRERLTNRLYSAHWRGWLKPENRFLVPANSFAEYAPEPNPETKKKDVVWFALNDDRPLFAFAGIWTTFNGDRGTKSKPIPGPIRSTAS